MPYPENVRRSAVAVKVEPTSGTDSLPTVAANAVITMGEPTSEEFYLSPNTKEEMIFGAMGELAPELPSGRARRFRFRTPLYGLGSAYSAVNLPPHHAILLAFGFTHTVVTTAGAEKVIYNLSDIPSTTTSIRTWRSGKRYGGVGCVGESFSATCRFGAFPVLDLSLIGAGLDEAEDAYVIPTFLDAAYPIFRGAGSLAISRIDGTLPVASIVAREWGMTIDAMAAARGDANGADALAGYTLTNRVANMTATMEVGTTANWNPHEDRRTRLPRRINARFGQLQAKYFKVDIEMGHSSIGDVADGSDEGISVYRTGWRGSRPPGANKELQITFS